MWCALPNWSLLLGLSFRVFFLINFFALETRGAKLFVVADLTIVVNGKLYILIECMLMWTYYTLVVAEAFQVLDQKS